MKQILALALLAVLTISVSLSASHQQSGVFVLEFERAAKQNYTLATNAFSVKFNGKTIKDYNPTDYKIYTETLKVSAIPSKNTIDFIGRGPADGNGQTIDNVKIYRFSACGYQNAIRNGGFEEGHLLGRQSSFFSNGVIPGWNEVANTLEIGWGKIYNQNWPELTHVCELDASGNADVYQSFTLDSGYRLL